MPDNYIHQQKQLIKKIEESLAAGKVQSTIVEMQKDYAHDDQTCLTLACFVPDDTADKIVNNIIDPLKIIEPDYYYYFPGSLHLTLKNIRTIHKPPLFTEEDIARVDKVFKEIIPQFPPISYYLEDLLLMPTSVSLMGYTMNILKKLVKTLDRGMNKIGVPDDKKYFSDEVFFGNVTLCRFTHRPSTPFVNKVQELKNINIGEVKIVEANLITCNAVCHPKTRKVISTYKFKTCPK